MKLPVHTAAVFRRLTIVVAAIVMTLGIGLVTAAPASAAACRFGVVCGTVVNETPASIRVCTSWGRDGRDFRYYPNYCRAGKQGTVRPYTAWGSPRVDIDAIYVPPGRSYYAVSYCPSGLPRRLTHQGGGWWKFPSICTIYIRLAT